MSSWPRLAPQFLGDVGHERCGHQHHRLGDGTRRRVELGDGVVQFDQLGDRRVEPERVHLGADDVDRAVQSAWSSRRRAARRRPCSSPVSSSTMLRHRRCRNRYIPITSRVSHGREASSRTRRHLVQAQGVGAVGGVHLVGLTEFFRLLPILPYSRLTGVRPSERSSAPSRSSTSLGVDVDRHARRCRRRPGRTPG